MLWSRHPLLGTCVSSLLEGMWAGGECLERPSCQLVEHSHPTERGGHAGICAAMPAGSLHTQAVMGFSPALQFTQTPVTALLSHLLSALVLCLKGWGSHVQCEGHLLPVLCTSQKGCCVSCFLQSLVVLDPLCSMSPPPHIARVQDLPCWRSPPMSHLYSCGRTHHAGTRQRDRFLLE